MIRTDAYLLNTSTGKGLVRRADNVNEAAEMAKFEDGGKALRETLEIYTAVANGDGTDEFGKTVFPVKNFIPDEPLCEYLNASNSNASMLNVG